MARKTGSNAKGKGGFSLGTVADILNAARESEQNRSQELSLVIFVSSSAPREVALTVKEALMPELATASVRVSAMADAGFERVDDSVDAVVSIAGSDVHEAASVAASWASAGVPSAVIVESALDEVELDVPEQVADLITYVAATSEDALREALAAWLLDAIENGIAVAANFPFARKIEVDRLTNRCAMACAGIGAVEFLKGADLVLMSARQAKLALDVAACYGRPIDLSRAVEVGGVVGLGLAYRALARSLVSLVPGFKTFLKAGIGYGGTRLTSRVLEARFQLEDSEGGIGAIIADAFSKAREAAEELPAALPRPRVHEDAGPADGGDGGSGYITLEA